MREAVKSIILEEIEGYTKKDAEYWFDNPEEYCCATGCIGLLVYCSDAEEFAKEHHDEIVELMEECGTSLMSLNDMAWFGFEATVPNLKDEILEELFLTDDEIEEAKEEILEIIENLKNDKGDGNIKNQLLEIIEQVKLEV